MQPLHDHVSVTSWRGAMIAGPAMALQKAKRAIKQTPILWAAVVKVRAVAALLRGRAKAAQQGNSEGDPT